MDLLISFLVSIGAGIVSYYICKWLDGDDSDISLRMLYRSKEKNTYELALVGVRFVLTHLSHFLAVAIITYSNSYFKYSLLPVRVNLL